MIDLTEEVIPSGILKEGEFFYFSTPWLMWFVEKTYGRDSEEYKETYKVLSEAVWGQEGKWAGSS